MLKVTGLWLNAMAGSGEKYMTGSWGNVRVVVFKNNFKKEGSKEPDYTLYLDEQKKKEQLSLDDETQTEPEQTE